MDEKTSDQESARDAVLRRMLATPKLLKSTPTPKVGKPSPKRPAREQKAESR